MPDIHPVLLKWTITLKDTILRVFAVRVLKLRKDAKPFIFFVGFFGGSFFVGGERAGETAGNMRWHWVRRTKSTYFVQERRFPYETSVHLVSINPSSALQASPGI